MLQQNHRDVTVTDLPPVLLPRKGPFDLVDYEKAYCPDPAQNIFTLRNLDRDQGCLVVVRPDQYVAHVLPLDAHHELVTFFEGVLLESRAPNTSAQHLTKAEAVEA